MAFWFVTFKCFRFYLFISFLKFLNEQQVSFIDLLICKFFEDQFSHHLIKGKKKSKTILHSSGPEEIIQSGHAHTHRYTHPHVNTYIPGDTLTETHKRTCRIMHTHTLVDIHRQTHSQTYIYKNMHTKIQGHMTTYTYIETSTLTQKKKTNKKNKTYE